MQLDPIKLQVERVPTAIGGVIFVWHLGDNHEIMHFF